jgi:hypothetical protein
MCGKKWSYDKVESIMKVSRTKELKTETDDRVLDATEHWPSRGRGLCRSLKQLSQASNAGRPCKCGTI